MWEIVEGGKGKDFESPCHLLSVSIFFPLISATYINIHEFNLLWTRAGANLFQSQTVDVSGILMNNFFMYLPQTGVDYVKFDSISIYGTCAIFKALWLVRRRLTFLHLFFFF